MDMEIERGRVNGNGDIKEEEEIIENREKMNKGKEKKIF
jgi:hypothetical protein